MNRKRFLWLTCAVFFCVLAKAQSGSIVAMEYWLDGQLANKQQLTATTAEIDIEDLSPGFHFISVRSKDDKGLWSSVQTKHFLIPRPTSLATSVTAMEYWLDGQIATKQTLSSSTTMIDIENLSPGFHYISVRAQDDQGLWSSVQTRNFVVPKVTETATITHYCYWFDDNTENVVTCAYTGSVDLMEIKVSGLSYYTEHKISLATRDSKGAYSTVLEEIFIIEPITTVINSTKRFNNHEDWYSLDGKKLNGRPTERGIYIRNGKKIILK